jgi:hypothetical protein
MFKKGIISSILDNVIPELRSSWQGKRSQKKYTRFIWIIKVAEYNQKESLSGYWLPKKI